MTEATKEVPTSSGDVNDYLIALVGKSTAGKSTALMGLEDPEGVLYLNCESGKKLPFPAKFKQITITDPMMVHGIFEKLVDSTQYHTIVIDSITYLMDMYESQYVLTSDDGRKAWGDYQQFFKKLMQYYIPKSNRVVIIIAHTADTINKDAIRETAIPIKGALKNLGLESYFSLVVAAKRMPIVNLKDYKSDLLNITPREEMLKFKHVLQTDITVDTVNERLRAPIGLFQSEETFVDGNIQIIIDRLKQYYK